MNKPVVPGPRPVVGAAAGGLFSGMRFPRLFVITLVLFLADLAIPDFIPFIDELLLGALAAMLAMLRKKRDSSRQGEGAQPPPPAEG